MLSQTIEKATETNDNWFLNSWRVNQVSANGLMVYSHIKRMMISKVIGIE